MQMTEASGRVWEKPLKTEPCRSLGREGGREGRREGGRGWVEA